MKRIPTDTFADCEKLAFLEIPSTGKSIGTDAFSDCMNLKEIHVSKSIEVLDKEMFHNCLNLEKIKWKGKIYSIHDLDAYGRFS